MGAVFTIAMAARAGVRRSALRFRRQMPEFVSSADGTRIACECQGVGSPALILVHGWSCDRGYWADQVARLFRGFQVVTADLAGHGDSDGHRQDWTIESFGDDIAAVANYVALSNVVLGGHSRGGGVISEAARRLPNRVNGLVWVDTHSELPHVSTAEQVRQRMAPLRANFVESTRALIRTMFGAASDPSLVERVARGQCDA